MDVSATRPLAGDKDIAVIGMAGRFPGSRDVDGLWRSLRDGVEAIRFFAAEELAAAGVDAETLASPRYVRAHGVVADVELFDAAFFGFTPREAELMDPQQRLLLECSWETLEDAGCDPRRFGGLIGVFAGAGANTYAWNHLAANPAAMGGLGPLQAALGNEKDFLATNISYRLDLRGPSFTVQSACSTSLVAVHLAMQSLLGYECDLALAGGANVSLPQLSGYWHQAGSILSPDGHCRAYDAAAAGTVAGNGVAMVALKRLADAQADGDAIRAVLRGSAVNNDGAQKVGFTAPGVEGQAEVIAAALAMAGVHPRDVSYIEGHGTGTPLGDPIEVRALTRVFRAATADCGFCALGSAKTNLGHLDAAAGVTGLIKTVQALEHRLLPPSLHFERPNPELDLDASPFYVSAAARGWNPDRLPRRAGVSAFGIGGTNAHVVLEEAPAATASTAGRPCQLLVLSARTEEALGRAAVNLARHLTAGAGEGAVALADIAWTLQTGRRELPHRLVVVAASAEEAAASLRARSAALPPPGAEEPEASTAEALAGLAAERERPLVFLLPGQGSQRAGMAADLYRHEPGFRDDLDRCAELLQPHLGLDLRRELAAGGGAAAGERLRQTALAQPALFAVEYSLARLWMRWGLRPEAMLGHSLGELVAACLAGVMPLPQALRLVAARGRLMQELPPGAMLSVQLPAAEVEALLSPRLWLAADNAPCSAVLSGEPAAVAVAAAELGARGVRCRPLRTSHAFHSAMVEPILGRYAEEVARVELREPEIPFLSNVSGGWITPAEATSPTYWVEQLRRTVRFGAGAAELLRDPHRVFLEVGPGAALRGLLLQQPATAGRLALASLPPGPRAAVPEDGGRAGGGQGSSQGQLGVGQALGHVQAGNDREPLHGLQGGDLALLYRALSRLWLGGFQVDWQEVHSGERRRRVRLPTYPFKRQRHWIEPLAAPGQPDPHATTAPGLPGGAPSAEHAPGAPAVGFSPPPDGSAQVPAVAGDGGGLPAEGRGRPGDIAGSRPAGDSSRPLAAAPAGRPALPAPYVAPGDARERTLVAIWEELLGIRGIGVADDFYDLGGQSLLAVAVAEQVERRLGVPLPAGALAGPATIRGLAAQLPPAGTPAAIVAPPPRRVLLRAGGSGPPLWWVHPIGGSALCYRELARHLGDRGPIYGLQAAGLADGEAPSRSVEEMAERYLEELREEQPAGPYWLAGWSFGGLVAFEMSRRLRAGGQEVGRLLLLDAWPLTAAGNGAHPATGNGDGDGDGGDTAFGTIVPGDGGNAGSGGAAGNIPDPAAAAGAILAAFLRDLAGSDREGRLPPLSVAAVERLFAVFGANLEAARRYRPAAAPAPVPVALWRAADAAAGTEPPAGTALERWWSALAGTPVTAETVPGTHYTMLAAPHVEILAERLRRRLDEP